MSPCTRNVTGLAILGATWGAGAYCSGFYDFSVAAPLTLCLLSAAIALTVWSLVTGGRAERRGAVGWAGWTALAAIAGLWLWSRLSTGWAADPGSALVGSDGWLLDLLALGLALKLIRTDRLAVTGLAAISAVMLAFGVYLAVRLAGSSGPRLFDGGRLTFPIGYGPAECGFLLLGAWPLIGVAEQLRGLRSGLALAAATFLIAIALLGQSRSAELGAFGSVALMLILVPGRSRRFWALAVLAAAVWLTRSPILAVYTRYEAAGSGAMRLGPAALAAVFAAVIAGAIWTAAGEFARLRRHAFDRVARWAAAGVGGIAVVVMIVLSSRIAHAVSRVWHDFVSDTETTGETASRFASGGGNRHEYWRVALREFTAHPLHGVGANNYVAGWMRLRRVSEDITQPHSIEFQTLAELGLVGGLLLLLVIATVFVGIVRHGRRSRTRSGEHRPVRQRSRLVAVGGGGTFLVWLLVSSGDWLHLFPAATGLALIALAALLAPSDGEPGQRESGRHVRSAPRLGIRHLTLRAALVAVLLAFGVVAAVSVGRPMLSNHDVAMAQADLRNGRPVPALADANRALDIDSRSLAAYYVRAAAYAGLDEYPPARATLLSAARLDPQAFATWLLLGDLADRRGDIAQAKAAYGRAHALDPLETEFQGYAAPGG